MEEADYKGSNTDPHLGRSRYKVIFVLGTAKTICSFFSCKIIAQIQRISLIPNETEKWVNFG